MQWLANAVETIVSHDIIGRLMIQCARQRGLANTYEKLLGFEGHEFYFEEFPELVGKTFAEVRSRWSALHCRSTCHIRSSTELLVAVVVVVSLLQSQLYFTTAIACGVKCAPKDGSSESQILLNPSPDYVFQEGDELLALAEDDSTYKILPEPHFSFDTSQVRAAKR